MIYWAGVSGERAGLADRSVVRSVVDEAVVLGGR